MQALNNDGWNFSFSVSATLVPSLNGISGYAVQINVSETGFNGWMSRALPGYSDRVIGGARLSSTLLNNGGFVFFDGATALCSILIQANSGLITINQGIAGAQLQASTYSVAANTAHYIEFDVTFGTGAFGGWTVWLDGVKILQGNGTTVQGGSSAADVVGMFTQNFTLLEVDDFYLFDSTGSYNYSALLTNPIVLTQAPIGDQQTQFTNLGNVFGNYYQISNNFAGLTTPANVLYLNKIFAQVNCTAESVVVSLLSGWAGAPTANMKGVIYSDNSGSPGTLISSGTQVTGLSGAQPTTLPLASPPNLTAGTYYWIGFICDTSVPVTQYANNIYLGEQASNTYASGAPATAPSMTVGIYSAVMYVSCNGASTNWESVAPNPPFGDTSAVSSASVGVTDLYVFPALPTVVQDVYAIAVGANARATYAGVRTFQLQAKSQGTTGDGRAGNITPTTNYLYYTSNFDVDPHTSAAWTVSGVNAGFFGMAISS
jgi:hypothetical protein